MADVQRAYDAILPINSNFCILQCTSGYPSPYEELNLRVIETFAKAFPRVVIGFSAHDAGISMPLVAYMLGARVFEKHFTLNRTWKGTDQAFSLEPAGLRRVVRDLHRTVEALGIGREAALRIRDQAAQQDDQAHRRGARPCRRASVLDRSRSRLPHPRRRQDHAEGAAALLD